MVLAASVWNRPFSTAISLVREVDLPLTPNRPRVFASSAVRPSQSVSMLMLPEGVRIPDSELRSRRALVVEAEVTRDGYVVRSGNLDEESFGNDPEEALRDFLTSLADRYRSLAGRRDRLSEDDQAVLTRLTSLLGPEPQV